MNLKKFTKAELIKKLQEFDSKKYLNNSNIEKLSIKDLLKLWFNILRNLIYNLFNFISKLSVISLFFKCISKFWFIKYIWNLFNVFLVFIIGLAYSDIYGFNNIYEELLNIWNKYIGYIQETKFYQFIKNILSSSEESPNKIEKEEVQTEEKSLIKEQSDEVSNNPDRYTTIEENQIANIEDNRENSGNSRVNEPFYWNKYFLITLSIISLSLIYYYWDNISELVDKLRNIKPDDGSETIKPDNSSVPDIELINLSDVELIPDYHENLAKDTIEILKQIENKIRVSEIIENNPYVKGKLPENIDLIALFSELKEKYIQNIELFNKLIKLDKDSPNTFKIEDRVKMLKNLNTIEKVLNKHFDVIPNFDLNLTNLPEINLPRPISPELVEATTRVHDFNSYVQNDWKMSTSSSSLNSPASDTTVKPLNDSNDRE